MNESCHTHESVISIRLSHVISINESRHEDFGDTYGVALDSRIDKIIGLFRSISSLLQGSFGENDL